MNTAKEILKNKSKEIWSVTPDNTVFEALTLMGEKEIGALMVIDNNAKVQGIISERDYARKIILLGKTSRDTKVSEIMTPVDKMFTVKPDTTVEDCMVLITAKRIRHIPVFDNDQFVGLISIGDVVKWIIEDQADSIQFLEKYITGR